MFVWIGKTCTKNLKHSINSKKQVYNVIPRKFLGESNKSTRTFSTIFNNSESMFTQNDIDGFKAHLPNVVAEFTQDNKYTENSKLKAYLSYLLNYTLPQGHCYRGLTTVTAYKMLAHNNELTSENLALAKTLGWIVETLETYIVMVDDILDKSEMRRGLPSWHRIANNGLKCVYDILFLQKATFALLKTHFAKHPCYVALVELFHNADRITAIGQTNEKLGLDGEKIVWELFDLNNYDKLVRFKSSYSIVYEPIAAAMYMAKINDQEVHREVYKILSDIGIFFQMENDFNDLNEITRSRETHDNDIRRGQITWFAAMALHKANPSQKKILKENYGKCDDEAERKIRHLYTELDLMKDFVRYKEESFEKLEREIQNMKSHLNKEFFIKVLKSFYQVKYS